VKIHTLELGPLSQATSLFSHNKMVTPRVKFQEHQFQTTVTYSYCVSCCTGSTGVSSVDWIWTKFEGT